VDEAGIVGDTVQLPSFGVWRVIEASVQGGARSAAAAIRAIGGHDTASTEYVSAFTIECCLAILVPRENVPSGSAIRVLTNGAWRTTRLAYEGTSRVTDGGPRERLSDSSWWYEFKPDGEQAQAAAGPQEKRGVAKIKLTGKAPRCGGDAQIVIPECGGSAPGPPRFSASPKEWRAFFFEGAARRRALEPSREARSKRKLRGQSPRTLGNHLACDRSWGSKGACPLPGTLL
jgi:hypothetical protein